MQEDPNIPLLDHELAADELAWMQAVYDEFVKAHTSFASRGQAFDPRAALRDVLGRQEYRLATQADLSGPGPWRLGQNPHGRGVAAVFLSHVELHRHSKSRTDQFPMYVVGEADGFSIGTDGRPVLTPVTGGDHFHNPPGAPHAFVPKVGKPVPDNWEIAFIAITPRNLREDTQPVSDEVRTAYKRVVGTEAPTRV
ncbi:MAG TPA: hypothetical protein VHX12_04620 [Acidisoma sp.]|jgi:hypothetical protein|nr:hypothetical protein [Acidisoma sp.]